MLLSRDHELVMATGLLDRCRFPGRDTIVGPPVCAVSGGADSSALLILTLAGGFSPHVIHFDHGLREESASEARFVQGLCDRFSVTCEVVKLNLSHGPNLEERARQARYAHLPPNPFTGHTADDLVETVLLNLIRGAGLNGLTPMGNLGGPIRPIISLRRSETVLICNQLGIDFRVDEMNFDPNYRRVRVRQELVGLMGDIGQRDIVPILARQTDQLRLDAQLLEQLAADIDPTCAKTLAAAHPSLASRAIRQYLARTGVTIGPTASQALVERVLKVARGEAIGADLVRGWRIERSSQRLRVCPPVNSEI